MEVATVQNLCRSLWHTKNNTTDLRCGTESTITGHYQSGRINYLPVEVS